MYQFKLFQLESLQIWLIQYFIELIKQTQIKQNGLTIFYVFFVVILVLNCLNIIGIILFGCCGKSCCRVLSHISWVGNAILMIITFLLGSVFSIVSIFGTDSSQSFLYLFSNESLASGQLFQDKNSSTMISICINNDGDLANRYFNLAATGVASVAQLYNASLALNQTQSNVSQYNNSVVIGSLKLMYQNNSNDITTVLFPDSDSPTQIKSIITKWTGWSDSNTNKQMASCQSPAQDLFFQSQSSCPAAYSYTNGNSAKANLGSKSCLVVTDWTASVNYFLL